MSFFFIIGKNTKMVKVKAFLKNQTKNQCSSNVMNLKNEIILRMYLKLNDDWMIEYVIWVFVMMYRYFRYLRLKKYVTTFVLKGHVQLKYVCSIFKSKETCFS
jgi:hypothetical protein